MKGVQRARFCHNRKDAEDTYLPADDVLYRLNNGTPWHGRLDLSGWGVDDDNMSGIATVSKEGSSKSLFTNLEASGCPC